MLTALRGRGAKLTRGDAIAASGLPEDEAGRALTVLLKEYRSHLSATETGELLYEFDPAFARRDAVPFRERAAAVADKLWRGFSLPVQDRDRRDAGRLLRAVRGHDGGVHVRAQQLVRQRRRRRRIRHRADVLVLGPRSGTRQPASRARPDHAARAVLQAGVRRSSLGLPRPRSIRWRTRSGSWPPSAPNAGASPGRSRAP